jgi:hypothetical protein
MNFQVREVLAPYVDAELHLTLTNNTISGITSSLFGFQGINFQSGSSGTAPDDVSMFLNMTGNIVNGTAGLEAYSFRQRTGTVFAIQGLSPASGATEAQIEAYIQANNPGGTLGGNTIVASAGGTTHVSYTAGSPPLPTTPTLPPVAPLMAADPAQDLPATAAPQAALPSAPDAGPPESVPAAAGQPTVVDDGVLSQAEIDLIVAAAIDRWAAAGATAEQLAAMRAVTFSVEDMTGRYLGSSSSGQVTIDSDAAAAGTSMRRRATTSSSPTAAARSFTATATRCRPGTSTSSPP